MGLTETEYNNLKANPKKWSGGISNAKFFLGEAAIDEDVQSSVNIYASFSYGMYPVFLYAPDGIHRSDTMEIWVANALPDKTQWGYFGMRSDYPDLKFLCPHDANGGIENYICHNFKVVVTPYGEGKWKLEPGDVKGLVYYGGNNIEKSLGGLRYYRPDQNPGPISYGPGVYTAVTRGLADKLAYPIRDDEGKYFFRGQITTSPGILLKGTSSGNGSMELTDAIISYSDIAFVGPTGEYMHKITTSVPYTYTTIIRNDKYSDVDITLLTYSNNRNNAIDHSYTYDKTTRKLTIRIDNFPSFINATPGAGHTHLYIEYTGKKDRLLKMDLN